MIGWTPAPHGLHRLPLRDIAVTAVVASLCVSLARRPRDRIAEREAESTEDMIARIERELDGHTEVTLPETLFPARERRNA